MVKLHPLLLLLLGACARAAGGDAAPAPALPPDPPIATHVAPAATPASSHALYDMPMWAYGITTLPQPGDVAAPQGWGRVVDPNLGEAQFKPLHVAGSSRSYSHVDLTDWANAVDWFPGEHAPMPDVVQHGPASLGEKKRACAFCHRVSGGGRPENAPIAHLPVAYFLRQLDDFRSGRRRSSDPRKPNVPTMIALAQALGAGEARAAAEYFAAQSGAPRVRIVETERAPPTRLHGNLFVATGSERSEPLVDRIVEVPVDYEQANALDNPHVGYMAYVPIGSIARGRALATKGNDADAQSGPPPATPACATCHGPDLRGLGDAPPIAGRSPSYLVRQLYDFKTEVRDGTMAPLMKPVVARLTTAQMTDLAAYIASLEP